ncbi:glycoside hydrolase family 5 protein [Candidatus Binatia bacterium]|nr:glycoside hydrolase family 5 protein [Candidatus Binatia bacterium]
MLRLRPVHVRSRRALVLLLLPLALAACSDATGGGAADPLRLPALHAEPDPIAGGRIVDAEGREVLLRGVNVNALAEYWASRDFPTTFPFTEEDADRIAGIGWNAVRLLLSWSRVEPAPGEYDEAYLDEVEGVVRTLAARGVYTIVDLHQDAWGATLAAGPDEACPATASPALGWDGAPAWATLDGGAARCATAGIRETSPAVLAAFDAFWTDAPGPDGVGIRTRYARMLGHVARRFADETAVAGYDVMNEPNAFTPAAQQALADLYAAALREIRAAERAAGGFPHLVVFEPSALWSALGRGAPPDFVRDRDVVYGPHVYTGGINAMPLTRDNFAIARDEAALFGGAPVLVGEWGSGPDRAADPADRYFLVHQELQDEYAFSATLWTWRESCGDPHKAADYQAGRIPDVWGEFEVDCRSNEITGVRQPLVDQLTRGWVRAAPGVLEELRWEHDAGTLQASGRAAASGTELLAFYPRARLGMPRVSTSGLDDARFALAPGGNVYLLGTATGGAWSITAQP